LAILADLLRVAEVRKLCVFGTEWGLSIVGRWLAILSAYKGEVDFRIRYSVACLLSVPPIREPDAAADLTIRGG
jgi:hypothetical protein